MGNNQQGNGRIHERINSKLDVRICRSDMEENDHLDQTYTANVSKSGLFVETDLGLQEEEIVMITLYLPDDKGHLSLEAIVRQVSLEEPQGVGLQILDISDEDAKVLKSLA